MGRRTDVETLKKKIIILFCVQSRMHRGVVRKVELRVLRKEEACLWEKGKIFLRKKRYVSITKNDE